MKQGPLIFLGVFFTLATSWCGLIFAPQLQLGSQQPVKIEARMKMEIVCQRIVARLTAGARLSSR